MNVTIFGNRMFADVINDLEMRSSCFYRIVPKSNNEHPYKRKKRRKHRDIQRGKSCENGDRDWSFTSTSQGTSSIAGSHQKLGERDME